MDLNNIKDSNTIVVKVGTSTLTHSTGKINIKRIEILARVLSDIHNSGKNIILVSSGAIAVGVGVMNLTEKPAETRGRQAVAAIGQCELMSLYGKLFGEYGQKVAQVLLTKDVVDIDYRRQNAVNTFKTLLDLGVIPIVNENDTISVEEIEFGDNDTLSAVVSVITEADLLIILSDIDGLFNKDPRTEPDAVHIPVVEEVTDEIRALAGGVGSSRGTGGMITKIRAAEISNKAGINMVIANGENPTILYDIVDGKPSGTLFIGNNLSKNLD